MPPSTLCDTTARTCSLVHDRLMVSVGVLFSPKERELLTTPADGLADVPNHVLDGVTALSFVHDDNGDDELQRIGYARLYRTSIARAACRDLTELAGASAPAARRSRRTSMRQPFERRGSGRPIVFCIRTRPSRPLTTSSPPLDVVSCRRAARSASACVRNA
jgi:hypothetical protein